MKTAMTASVPMNDGSMMNDREVTSLAAQVIRQSATMIAQSLDYSSRQELMAQALKVQQAKQVLRETQMDMDVTVRNIFIKI